MEVNARLQELKQRLSICIYALHTLNDQVPDTDPRKKGAIEEYEKQKAHIVECIKAVEEGRPEPIVVGLKSAVLTSTAPKKE